MMKFHRYLHRLFIVAVLLLCALITAQESFNMATVYAPYPTNIRVGFQESTVVITWQDSPDHTGTYNIYRSLQLPDISNYKNAELLGTVSKGIQKFSYKATNSNLYYYFVLPVTDQKQVIEVFIPLQNYTLIPVRVENISETAVPSVLSAQADAIKQFKLRQNKTSIVINFTVSNYKGKVFLYRSQKPFVNLTSLLEAVQIKSFEVNVLKTEYEFQIEDTPFPGIQYYWSVLTEAETSSLNFKFIDGKNTSNTALSLSFANQYDTSAATPRYAPLPVLQSANIFLPSQRTEAYNFSESALKNISIMFTKYKKSNDGKVPEIQYIHKKLAPEFYNEAAILSTITDKYFSSKQYSVLIEEINKFLAIPRSKSVKAAAVFYRAQANALLGNYQEALLDAVLAYEVFPVEADSWITYLVRQLREKSIK